LVPVHPSSNLGLSSPSTPEQASSQIKSSTPSEKSVNRTPMDDRSVRRPLSFDRSLLERILSAGMLRSTAENPVTPDVSDHADGIEQNVQQFRAFRIVCADPTSGETPKRNLLERCSTLQLSGLDRSSEDEHADNSLERACEGIARNVVREAFHQWLSCCRKLRILRSRLVNVVTPRLLTVDSPTDASTGIDRQSWQQLRDSTDTWSSACVDICLSVAYCLRALSVENTPVNYEAAV
uniref:Pecanex-like protein n=1 Tax=Echinostoma caproni TaxID=27848 RepID=A0A183B547_9TREM